VEFLGVGYQAVLVVLVLMLVVVGPKRQAWSELKHQISEIGRVG
jgi:hypothetical protein